MFPSLDTLAAHPGHWLTIGCACGRRIHLPTKMLARQHGGGARLPEIVARLRCRKCGARPIEADLRDDVQTSASGFARGYPGSRPSG
jgi:hypothetical protein